MPLPSYISSFPAQKKPRRLKTQIWAKQCINAGLQATGIYDSSRRSSKKTKLRNYNLYNGRFDKNDLEYEVQPISLEGYSFPAEIQYRDIISPIFNLLFGEEAKRGLHFVVRASNEDTISEKEKVQKQMVLQMLQDSLITKEQEEEQVTPEQVQKYLTYDYQDMRESIASKLLHYLRRQLNIESIFQKGWEDVLIAGEEIYKVETLSNEPVISRRNPVEISYLLSHNSDLIDDADIIVEETYMSIGKIIDDYYELLTPVQIDRLEGYLDKKEMLNTDFFILPGKSFIVPEEELTGQNNYNDYFDEHGNMRVCKVVWKSRQKIGFLTYLDEEGNYQETIVSEDYKYDKDDPNITIKWKWRNQYWEGTKIGGANIAGVDVRTDDGIYLNIGPRKQQFRRMDNISACKSGYVGTVYNANNSQSVSLMDRLVPWVYLHITLWYRTELLIAANQGKIAMIDLAMIPPGWEMDKWIYYASIMKFAFVDSFAEGVKGQSTGKLAGNMVQQTKALDLETGNAIQGHISLIEYIENKIEEISGVTSQRKGDIKERELVRNVERSVVQSSHKTEKWFQVHNWTKQRALEALVEVAKDTYYGKSKKLQYITDDLATVFFTLDGNEFNNSEYGVFVSNASKDQQALDALKQLTQVALQSDKVAFSDVVNLYLHDSIADVKNKLLQAEKAREQVKQQSEDRKGRMLKAVEDDKRALEVEKMDREDANKDKDRQVDLETTRMQVEAKMATIDRNRDNVPDILQSGKMEGDRRKLDLEEQKRKDRKEESDKKIELKKEDQRIKERIENKKLKKNKQ